MTWDWQIRSPASRWWERIYLNLNSQAYMKKSAKGIRGFGKRLVKCVNVEIFREATHSSHEGPYVSRTVVQLPRDIGIVRNQIQSSRKPCFEVRHYRDLCRSSLHIVWQAVWWLWERQPFVNFYFDLTWWMFHGFYNQTGGTITWDNKGSQTQAGYSLSIILGQRPFCKLK